MVVVTPGGGKDVISCFRLRFSCTRLHLSSTISMRPMEYPLSLAGLRCSDLRTAAPTESTSGASGSLSIDLEAASELV